MILWIGKALKCKALELLVAVLQSGGERGREKEKKERKRQKRMKPMTEGSKIQRQ